MNSLTPFIHHALPDRPGPSSAPEANCSRCSPPLGKQPDPTQPPGDPSAPGTQLPPPEVPGNPPHPEPGSAPQAGVPMTDGTPAACRQKNAAAFLAGETDVSVMAHYAPGLFSTEQKLDSRQPAPDDPEGVRDLVRLREDQPYG